MWKPAWIRSLNHTDLISDVDTFGRDVLQPAQLKARNAKPAEVEALLRDN